jgi:5'-phosphate synthase pdxT subunit
LTKVGILAIQGDFLEHRQMLGSIGVETADIRLPQQLDDIDGLIIPGGESTTIGQLIDIYGFRPVLKDRGCNGMPVWGTCAGMIVMADRLVDRRPEPLGLMDIEVSRNAFGRQLDSFEADLQVKNVDGAPFRGVFIRAPVVTEVGDQVEVLARLDDGRPVAVRQDRLLATAFHPELTPDSRLHELFVRIVEGSA